MDGTDSGRIPTNLRTLLILELVGQRSGPVSAAELGREMGLPKQTIHRLCNTLSQEGFLVQDHGGLRPGRRLRQMATGLLHASTSHIARHEILRAQGLWTESLFLGDMVTGRQDQLSGWECLPGIAPADIQHPETARPVLVAYEAELLLNLTIRDQKATARRAA